jgi:predicted SPOUT superfamily RNA methylase MTH1
MDAKRWCELTSAQGKRRLDEARKVVSNPDTYTGHEVKNAKELLRIFEELNQKDLCLEQTVEHDPSESKENDDTDLPY